MGILLGLVTALTWGGADFLARFATHRVGTLRTMFYMQATGFVLLTIFLPWLGGWGHLADGSGWQPWAWGLLAGCINAFSTLALYRSFEIGKMAVVAPLSASYPVLTIILSILTGERLTPLRGAGIVFTLLGMLVVAHGEHPADETAAEPAQRNGEGVGWAICSALGFGFLFWLFGIRIIPRVGATQTVWMIRLTCTILVGGVILLAKQPMRLPRGEVRPLALGTGILDTSAFVLCAYGMRMEQVAIISVLSSLYGAVTVALAAIFLREHVSRGQWAGIVSIFIGIYLISR
ncbi:MAG: EamA family transporter [Candidatus Acidiferrales bacterium]